MKVDMDGKNCNLPSEHTPLGQTNTEKAANYKICEYLGRIPGIHPETISFLSNFQKKKAVYEMLRRLLFLLPFFYFFYLSEQTKLIRFGNPVQNTVFLEQINQRASQRGALLQFLKCIEFTVLSPFHNALRRIHA